MASSELDEVFAALSHGLRRRIIALLAGSPNGLSYSELLRNTGVESSMLSFHLKKLKHLVERGEDGLYRLTRLGVKAASVLSCVQGDGGSGGLIVSGIPVFVVGDDMLLEAYRRGGLEIEDAGAVIILESSQSLFKKTVRAIRRTVVVYTPVSLLETVEARTAGVGAIIPYRGRPPVPADRPDAIVGDLYRRGYRAVAERLKSTLGSS